MWNQREGVFPSDDTMEAKPGGGSVGSSQGAVHTAEAQVIGFPGSSLRSPY